MRKSLTLVAAVALFSAGMAIAPAQAFADGGAVRSHEGFASNILDRNDDGSSGLVELGFDVNLFGAVYDSLYVNNNGNVTFDAPLGTYTPFDLSTPQRAIVAPFFADVDTRNESSGVVTYGQDIVDGRPAFGVNWINVGYYSYGADRLNSFQLVLIDRSDLAPGDFDIEFNFDQIQWETGSASGGSGGLGGNSARSGYSDGTVDGSYYEASGSGVPGSLLDDNSNGLIYRSLNSDVTGRMSFPVHLGEPAAGYLVIDPETFYIPSGGSRTYSVYEYDSGGEFVADVTELTEFTITPEGSCDGWVCTATVPGSHQVVTTWAEKGLSAAATLNVMQPELGATSSNTLEAESGSVMPDANGDPVLAIPRIDKSDVLVSTVPTCESGSVALPVNLIFDGQPYPMADQGDGSFLTVIPLEDLTSGELTVIWNCDGVPFQDSAGRIDLYDPAGILSHPIARSSPRFAPEEAPLPGASVTLFRVPTHRPAGTPGWNGATCQTNLTNPGGTYNQEPPSDPGLHEQVNPLSGTIAPAVNPFISNPAGYYGWYVTPGCYFVKVSKVGYRTQTSFMVGIPPEVTDLNLSLSASLSTSWDDRSDLGFVTADIPSVGRTTLDPETLRVGSDIELRGVSGDAAGGSTIRKIHVTATNENDEIVEALATMGTCDASCPWTVNIELGPGTWTLTAQAESVLLDLEPIEAANTTTITVVGVN